MSSHPQQYHYLIFWPNCPGWNECRPSRYGGPFVLINLVAGVSGLRFHVFMIGPSIGMLAGHHGCRIGDQSLRKALENPEWQNWRIFMTLLGALLGIFLWAKKRFT